MQKGLSFKRPMFEDNAEVSTSVIRTFQNKYYLVLFTKEPNITFLYLIHGTGPLVDIP